MASVARILWWRLLNGTWLDVAAVSICCSRFSKLFRVGWVPESHSGLKRRPLLSSFRHLSGLAPPGMNSRARASRGRREAKHFVGGVGCFICCYKEKEGTDCIERLAEELTTSVYDCRALSGLIVERLCVRELQICPALRCLNSN